MQQELKSSKKEFWEEKYNTGSMPWDIGDVAPAFVKYLNKNPDIKKGRVAILGCGRGHDGFYFAKNNFEVYGLDYAKNVIKYCSKLKEEKNLQNIYFFEEDLFTISQKEKWKNFFDYAIEHTTLCAIDPKKRTEYIESIKYLLKPGGRLIGLFFIRPLEKGGPPFGSSLEEIDGLLEKDFTEIEALRPEKCLHTKLEGDEWFGVFEKR